MESLSKRVGVGDRTNGDGTLSESGTQNYDLIGRVNEKVPAYISNLPQVMFST